MDKISAQKMYSDWKNRWFSPDMATDVQEAMENHVKKLHKELLGKNTKNAQKAWNNLCFA